MRCIRAESRSQKRLKIAAYNVSPELTRLPKPVASAAALLMVYKLDGLVFGAWGTGG